MRHEVPLAPVVVRELKNLYSRSAEHSQTHWYLPEAKKAFRSRRSHTHGTLLHSQGTPLKVAQAQLGHSHMATTLEIYTHASGSAQRDAVNLLAEQLFPNVPKLESSGRTAGRTSTASVS
ncbi:MAG: hypothetical protein DMG56_00170 [Acidobacteria bacterium]|nr:MAG: hypothetical protein DMG56_00170 [Acidobacteriota bacterium]